MAATEDLVKYLSEHQAASLTQTVGYMLERNSLEETIGAVSALGSAGFVAYDCRITLSLTPQGRLLLRGMESGR
jgi:hypothetical protein